MQPGGLILRIEEYDSPVHSSLIAALRLETQPPAWHGLSADNWIKIVAVAVGAAWTVMNFIRGRTYRKRLDVDLPGSFVEQSGIILFSCECKAKNLGSSEIPILAQGTGIDFFTLWLRKYEDGGWGVAEELIETRSLVESDAWIEPGETFRRTYILAVPQSRGAFVGVRLETLINNGKTVWTVSQICNYLGDKPTDKEKTDE